MDRPELPLEYRNPCVSRIRDLESGPVVKYQILSCQGSDILVGRLKIETPTESGHAFILRRYDTGAISLTTMYRAAFPLAPEKQEKIEMQWVKECYDLAGTNGSSKEPHISRLAGTWVATDLAGTLGRDYFIEPLVSLLVDATPDPSVSYRRSGKNGNATPKGAASSNSKPPLKVSSEAVPNPAKRRRESSPASSPGVPRIAAPTPRRSTRAKSPLAITSASMPSITTVAKPLSKRSTRRSQIPPASGGSEETAVEEDTPVVNDVAALDLYEQDVAEQKEMIAELKAKKAARSLSKSPSKASSKREREEDLKFRFEEPCAPETEGRIIATNKRVAERFRLEPRTKSAAWGIAAFVFGASAVAYLPNFF